MRLRHGANKQLEEIATEMILKSLEGAKTHEDKAHFMTPWKEKHRKTHEIMSNGAPIDPSVRRGMFIRAYNPVQRHLNSYDGPTRPMKLSSSWDPEDGSAGGTAMLTEHMDSVMYAERVD